MIAAWMLYTIAVTLILFAATSAAEYVGRALRAPTRFVWLLAMVAAVGLSARAFVSGLNAPQRRDTTASTAGTSFRFDAPNAAAVAPWSAAAPARPDPLAAFFATMRSTASGVSGAAQRIDVTPFDRWNRALIAVWVALTLMVIAWFVGSLIRLQGIERALTRMTINNQPVLVSENVGPALLGVVRTRIVLPRWALGLPQAERDVILAHERQHAAAFDPAFMFAAALLVAFQPWNVALWSLFARLRLALESDCDHRVLGRTGNAHNYARLLIAIYERTTPALSPYIAFAEQQSNLERRIRRMAERPRAFSTGAVASAVTAALLVTAACATRGPARRAVARTPPPLPVHAGVVQPATQFGRCSIFTHATFPEAGCSIDGDLLVATFDSSHVVVAARDTSDAGFATTDVFILAMRKGTVPPDLDRHTKTGRGTLTDSVFYYASPGQRTLAFRFNPRAVVRESGAQIVDVEKMTAIHSSVLTWDVLPQFATAPRCVPSSRPEPPQHAARRLGSVPIDPWTLEEGARACIVIGGTRVEFPIPQ
jgi:beta-lactamase regulating signal transducer with metallopeptidase domain